MVTMAMSTRTEKSPGWIDAFLKADVDEDQFHHAAGIHQAAQGQGSPVIFAIEPGRRPAGRASALPPTGPGSLCLPAPPPAPAGPGVFGPKSA